MGILDRLRGKTPAALYAHGRDHPMVTRWSVPPERNTAEWLATFRTNPRLAVIDRIAVDLASAPGKLYRAGDDGVEEEITTHPLLRLLAHPNPLYEYTASALWRLFEIYLLMKGEGYFLIERDAKGRPAELWPLPVHWVMMTPFAGSAFYQVRLPSGLYTQVPVEDMFIMKELNPFDPSRRGLGRAEPLCDEIETDEYAAKFQKRFFHNDATPNLIISMPESSKEQRERFRMEWLERFKGVFASHGIATVDGTVTVNKVADSMRDMDMVNGRLFMRDAVLEHFGMPREIMGITESSNRATSESAQYIYAQNVLTPRLRAREEAINRQLVRLFGDDIVYRFDNIIPRNQEFDQKKALDGWAAGLLTKNEARELFDLPPINQGEVYKLSPIDVYIRAEDDPLDATADMMAAQSGYAEPIDDVSMNSIDDVVDSDDADANHLGKARATNRDTKAILRATAREMDAAEDELTARFARAVSRGFTQQAARIAAALTDTPPKSSDTGIQTKALGSPWDIFSRYMDANGTVDPAKWSALTRDTQQTLLKQFVSSLANWPNERQQLFKAFAPLWRQSFTRGATVAQKLYGLEAIQRPELISTAQLRGAQRIAGIEQATKDRIRQIVSRSLEHGESPRATAQAIRQEMTATPSRANLIATQETITSLNAGHYEMCKTAGAQYKTWHHRPQKNPREGPEPEKPNHVAMDGETVPFDQPFSNGLLYPRDSDCDDAAQVINCRCYISTRWDRPKGRLRGAEPPSSSQPVKSIRRLKAHETMAGAHLTTSGGHGNIDPAVKADDDVEWITVNGAHIPVTDGELQGEVGQKIESEAENSHSQSADADDKPKYSASGANPTLPGFAKNNLYRHWGGERDHSMQYPDLDKEGYAKRAEELVRSPVGGDIDGCRLPGGAIVRYDKKANDYVKGYNKGIATMFKPNDGYEYFLREMRREGSVK